MKETFDFIGRSIVSFYKSIRFYRQNQRQSQHKQEILRIRKVIKRYTDLSRQMLKQANENSGMERHKHHILRRALKKIDIREHYLLYGFLRGHSYRTIEKTGVYQNSAGFLYSLLSDKTKKKLTIEDIENWLKAES